MDDNLYGSGTPRIGRYYAISDTNGKQICRIPNT